MDVCAHTRTSLEHLTPKWGILSAWNPEQTIHFHDKGKSNIENIRKDTVLQTHALNLIQIWQEKENSS